ncbi:carbon monoxide dehydrogenase [Streptomyces sp. NPDC051997]|uniref:carbon monoxide dehydrogenase n=1 Tax=Streptomyces sp. NPDC051997 TaxID=3155611 RepID=UPI00342EEBFA
MEHEVFVPFPAGRLREALADPVRVARAVPGLQQDASAVTDGAGSAAPGSPPASASGAGRDARVAGRLKVRVAGHTITYRGAFRVIAQDGDTYAVEGDATEVRGVGAVKLALTLRLLPADGGTTLVFGGTASGDGRVAELPHDAVSSTGLRLLTRFAASLTTDLAPSPGSVPEPEAGQGLGAEPDAEAQPAARTEPEARPGRGPEIDAGPEPEPDVETEPEPDAEAEFDTEAELEADTDTPAGFEADVTSRSPDPAGEGGAFDGEDFVAEAAVPGRADAMAEAAHARRTMIGRSAEEVDHAPPRGRYAPVPPPEATTARATLRWAAPAAALALASAFALSRALRKRR